LSACTGPSQRWRWSTATTRRSTSGKDQVSHVELSANDERIKYHMSNFRQMTKGSSITCRTYSKWRKDQVSHVELSANETPLKICQI
jgi:hypothetical protein